MAKKIEMSIKRFDNFKKIIYQAFSYRKGYNKCLMILGCQRSGTTLISNIFSKIVYCRVFGEFSKLSNKDEGRIRLNPTGEVVDIFNSCHSPLIVCKPLVESQNANILLKEIPESNILWVFRNYKDVALSDVKKFKKMKGHGNLLPIIQRKANNWRNENISDQTYNIINDLYSEHLNPIECACLFWYSRNILLFEQNLDHNQNVHILEYDDFIRKPLVKLNQILESLGFSPQRKEIVEDIYNTSISSASNIEINQDIKLLCDDLYEKIVETKTLNPK